jgi:hypothetical protein
MRRRDVRYWHISAIVSHRPTSALQGEGDVGRVRGLITMVMAKSVVRPARLSP